jgi:hypothetical protein
MVLAPPFPGVPGTPDIEFGAPPERSSAAADWLEAERHALYAAVQSAYTAGMDAEAWALCEPLWTHFLDHPHHTDAIEAFRTGVAAAQRAGNVRALIRMRCQLARPLWERERYEEAAAELAPAVNALRSLDESPDDRRLKASTVEFRGMLAAKSGDWPATAEDFTTVAAAPGPVSRRFHANADRLREIADAHDATAQSAKAIA